MNFLTEVSDIKESQNISSLHKQISACDTILEVSILYVRVQCGSLSRAVYKESILSPFGVDLWSRGI